MRDILLIDDEAASGWAVVLAKVLFPNDKLESADNRAEAIEKLAAKQYDLIFLDIRFGEGDHLDLIPVENMVGYKILNEEIRGEFDRKNFTTPVIVFTASNKVWNIDGMKSVGADAYYCKEHPDQLDVGFSVSNFEKLIKDCNNLYSVGLERLRIWSRIKDIVALSEKSIENKIIQERIFEKLKIGYGLMFREISKFENEKLLFRNESVAFIVFWSILEEISTDFIPERGCKKNYTIRQTGKKIAKYDKEFEKYSFTSVKGYTESRNPPSLSQEISLILQYYSKWDKGKIFSNFLALNKLRNKHDYIHSDIQAIRTTTLKDGFDEKKMQKANADILMLIKEIVE